MTEPALPEESLFAQALEIESAAERAAFLDRACGDNHALRAEVEALLRASERSGDLLDLPDNSGATTDLPVREGPGTVIGPYKLFEEIGEGGMGTVWMAEQTHPIQRRVAVKVVKEGMDSKQVLARFEAERQALALMDHPNIATVLDAGTTANGRPYFVMELVKGVPITKYCDDKRVGVRERLELFGDVCRAVQHAHQKGVIHRDLKPSNVLVAPYDGKPVVKVIDFGVAKATGQPLTEKTLVTGFGAIVGTLEYMSPEQAEVNQLDIDTRSDVYSLGVLLYELLTGTTPFSRKDLEKGGMLEMLRVIREQEPTKPSTKLSTAEGLPTLAVNRGTEPGKLTRLVRGELDWIVMKALEKDRNRRYETANAFALDVQHYLNDEPVQACPPSAWYRVRKFTRRHKAALLTASAGILAVLLAVGGIGWVLRDRWARAATVEREVDQNLLLATQLQGQGKRQQALAALRQAEGALAGGEGNEALRQRVRDKRADLDMLDRLEEIGLQKLALSEDGLGFDYARTAAQYAQAFRDFGIDVLALEPAAAADRIRHTAIRAWLVAALDDWARATRDRAESRHLFQVAQEADPEGLLTRWRQAQVRKDSAALRRIAAECRVETTPPRNLAYLGRSLFWTGAQKEAIRLLYAAQRAYPGDLWLTHDLAFALAFQKEPQNAEALRFFTAARGLREHSLVDLNIGCVLSRLGRYREAAEAFAAVIAREPNNALAHNNLGAALADQGKRDESIAAYRQAIRSQPRLAEAHCNLAYGLANKGDLDGAIAAARKAVEYEPDFADASNALGVSLSRKKLFAEATRAFRQATRLDPNYALAWHNLGSALSIQEDLEGALEAYRQATRLAPRKAEFHHSLGTVLGQLNRPEEARASFEVALRYRPNDALTHYRLGIVYRDLGKIDQAIACYRAAIRLRPAFDAAHYNLGNLFLRQGKYEQAADSYRQAVAARPGFALAHANRGTALFHQGRLDEACDAYREALKYQQPPRGDLHINLGQALIRRGKYDEAVKAMQHADRVLSPADQFRPEVRQLRAKWARLADLDRKLPSVLAGEVEPASAAEAIELTEICTTRQLFGAAAGLYEKAFAAQPALAADLRRGHRSAAARVAARAGCGQGQDQPALGAASRTRWRKQALAWLHADLALWAGALERDTPGMRASARRFLAALQQDPDLAGLRDLAALVRLPRAERNACLDLWAEVEALLDRAKAGEVPRDKP
jgi:serine/threonine protein kinase/tetratricopeptide (TPR) repeat protein